MPEARVGAIKKNNNFVKNNTTYEDISVNCEKTDSYVMKKRPVRSDVWIGPENLGQGTPTDDNVRGPSKEENKTSPYINQAGHFELAYDNASSMKSDRVTITALVYSLDTFGNLKYRGSYKQTFNNFHRKSLNDLPIRRAVNEELNKRFKPS